MNNKELVSKYIHTLWTRWMQHLFNNCMVNENGDYIMHKKEVLRRTALMCTPYELLSEEEKDKDRRVYDDLKQIFYSRKSDKEN